MKLLIHILVVLVLTISMIGCQKSRNEKFGEGLTGSWTVDSTVNNKSPETQSYIVVNDTIDESQDYYTSGEMEIDEAGAGWLTINAHQGGQTFYLYNSSIHFEFEHLKSIELGGTNHRWRLHDSESGREFALDPTDEYQNKGSFRKVDEFVMREPVNPFPLSRICPYALTFRRN